MTRFVRVYTGSLFSYKDKEPITLKNFLFIPDHEIIGLCKIDASCLRILGKPIEDLRLQFKNKIDFEVDYDDKYLRVDCEEVLIEGYKYDLSVLVYSFNARLELSRICVEASQSTEIVLQHR